MPVLRGFTLKTPKRRSSMRSPAAERVLHGLENGLDGLLGFGPGDIGFLYDGVYDDRA